MRVTRNLVQVAVAFLNDPRGRHWGYDLSKASGVRSGALYPMLTRFLNDGWVQDGWEDPAAAQAEKRPPRRFYKLTDDGLRELGAIVARAQNDARFTGLRERFSW